MGYNFFVDSLGFNKAVSPDNPYQRATAPFRKDQIDSAATPGDQSLTGWWTRGQLSFHMGAGVKYYDVDSSSTVLNRFQDSYNVDPWTPGEVVLSGAMTQVALTGIQDAVGGTHGASNGVWALGGGRLNFVDSAVGMGTSPYSGGTATSVTSSGTVPYVTSSNGNIEKGSTSAVTYTEYAKNPNLRSAGSAPTQTGTALQVATSSDGASRWRWRATKGQTFTPSMASIPAGKTCRVVVEQDASQPLQTYSVTLNGTTVMGPTNAAVLWTTFTSSSTNNLNIVAQAGDGTTVCDYYFTEFAVTDDACPTSPDADPYHDAAYSWTGAVDASTQTKTLPSGSLIPMWYPESGREFVRTWWVKGRLFAIDDLGQWYQLTTEGGTAVASNIFWSPALGTTGWTVAESPAAIYIGHGTDIYMLTPDSSGSVPTITTPVVAASLPTGESISTIFCYLGRLVICTNLGMRVAIVQSDGSLEYGDYAVEGDFSSNVRTTALRELAYVVGTRSGDSSPEVFTINMLSSVDSTDLAPAWSPLRTVTSGSGALFGAAATPDGRVMCWDVDGFWRTTAGLAVDGWLETGFHRLGTLDPKSFQFVRVKTEGTVGQVAVTALLPDGTSVAVGTVDAGTSTDLSLATAVPSPTEYIGLKFELTGDGTSGPTLMGYQLKALPVPKRQRLIRVPVFMFDVEQDASGHRMGKAKDAWTRLKALESYEEAHSIVTYKDDDTGETGTAYIESIETQVESTSSARASDRGFGGIVTITLRRIGD